MNRDEFRLELVRLTYTHGREVVEALARAKELEAYVLEPQEEKHSAVDPFAKKRPGRPPGKSGNLGNL